MIIGDLAFYAGIVGIILYICVLVIRHTTRIGKLSDGVRKLEDRIAAQTARKEEITAAHREKKPQVDELVKQVISLREERDRLQIRLRDLEAASQERTIEIKTARP